MRKFAQELVDLVIDSVAASGNTRDIGTCGSVCWGWLPRSRRHLFSCLTLWNALSYEDRKKTSSSSPATTESFLDLVDASAVSILSFVRRLDICVVLHGPWPSEQDMARFQSSSDIRELRIHGMEPMGGPQELQFMRWVDTHVPRFPSLTRFELVLPTDLPLSLLADLLSGLPFLEELRLYSQSYGTGIVEIAQVFMTDDTVRFVGRETVLGIDAFPRRLHMLDVALYRGTSLLFHWLLSHSDPPIFTSLKLGGTSRHDSMKPINAYLHQFGPKIESLSLAYSAVESLGGWCPEGTRALQAHILGFTPQLVELTLTCQHPETIPATLPLLPSTQLTTLNVGVYLFRDSPQPDWATIDALVATPKFSLLKRLSFTNDRETKSLITAEVKTLMPQASGRKILV